MRGKKKKDIKFWKYREKIESRHEALWRGKEAKVKNIFLIYTCHSKASWCSGCKVDHGLLLHRVGLRSSSPLRIAAIQTIDTLSEAVIYNILIF